MRRFLFFFTLLVLMSFGGRVAAQNDSVDALHYDICLDVDHLVPGILVAHSEVELRLLRSMDSVGLQLINSVIDSVFVNGVACHDFGYHASLLQIPASGRSVGDTMKVKIYYHNGGIVEPLSTHWGGFHIQPDVLAYNLGVAFEDFPHCYGRAWFPCRDNFYDKATYRLQVTTHPGMKSECGGNLLSRNVNEDGSETSLWDYVHPTPTYLVSVAISYWTIQKRFYHSIYGDYEATLAFDGETDSTEVSGAFDILEEVIPMYERCFGPYRWDRIGYVGTPQGSMEHVNNIALARTCMSARTDYCQSVICHELSHAWFGNLITCQNQEEMWFNEGGATFCEEVAMEAAFDRDYSDHYALANLEEVLRTAHLNDNGYRALAGMDSNYTYGSTVYKKGGTVWHSLRGYMGDSLFYATMRYIFDKYAFGNIDSPTLCQEMSDYSRLDLSEFFDFHVYNPGFVDYKIDSLVVDCRTAHLFLREKLVGTEQYATSNRVPVTYFGTQGESATRWATFEGTQYEVVETLPFVPVVAAVNFSRDLSIASIGDTIMPTKKGKVLMELCHFQANVKKVDSTTPTMLYVCHHWTKPDSTPNAGFVRLANRYWTVDGVIPEGSSFAGMFHFVKDGAMNVTFPYLDHDFYYQSSSFDSIAVLYRKNNAEPWKVVNAQLMGSTSDGYMVVNSLKKGEYTLAIIDEERMAISSPESQEEESSFLLFPNPSHGTFQISIPGEETHFELTVRNLEGKAVFQLPEVANGQKVECKVPAGIYLVELRNRSKKVVKCEKMLIN